MQLSLIDILFLVTAALLIFNGLRNGAVFSLFNLLGIPIGFFIAYLFGPRFSALLATNNLPVIPLLAYIVLFFGTALILHIIGTTVRGVVKHIPLIGVGDSLLGGVIGFAEAWLLWLFLLTVLGNFLAHAAFQQGPSLSIQADQLTAWNIFYNEAITHSLFAKINGFFIKVVPQ